MQEREVEEISALIFVTVIVRQISEAKIHLIRFATVKCFGSKGSFEAGGYWCQVSGGSTRCIRPTPEELENFGTPDFTIYTAGQFPCNRYTHYMTSSTSVNINLARKEMVILGTMYAGEMKKGLFSLMHYLMPKRRILSLHSGCNMGKDGDVAIFFGLYLIGDDEHCWSDNGVSNIEGGCYAKCIDLSKEKERNIWNAIKFGSVLEYVTFDKHTREVDYSDGSITGCWNRRGYEGAKGNILCIFGAAFLMLHPTKYAAMLAEKMQKHGATAWLVNTGWSGGRYGSGKRIKLSYARKIIDAIHSGSLLNANYKKTEVFGLENPAEIEGVPSEMLDRVNTWSDKKAYQETLLKLAGLFSRLSQTIRLARTTS
ncbi:hypothetical protein ACLB2K_004307 [Fragaria x ananassa]